MSGGGTIGARVAARDAERFVGRERELERLEALLTDAPEHNVVLVHGPAGVGKSALLRELTRRASRRGWPTVVADGGHLPHVPDALDALVAPIRDEPHALVVLDTWEAAEPLTVHLREGLLRDLPLGWLVVVSGREVPDAGWRQDGWEHVVHDLPVAVLGPDDARRCALAYGAADERATPLAAWSQGLPLAIVLGALANGGWEPGDPLSTGLADAMLSRIWGDWSEHLPALATAAIARTATPELLRRCLGGVAAEPEFEWLTALPFTTEARGGVSLHPAVADAVRTSVQERRPDLARDLRARIARHAHDDALRTGASVSLDLALLLEDPEIRWGFGWDRHGLHQVSACRSGDAEAVEGRLSATDRTTWWPGARRCFEEAPEHVWTVRRADGTVDGFMVVTSSTVAEPPLPDDPVLGPWSEHARARRDLGESVIWRNATDLTGDGRVQQIVGGGGLLVSGTPNPRFLYLPIDPAHEAAVAFSAALGGRHEPELDVDHGEGPTQCHIVDLGPGGMLGKQLSAVLDELGPTTSRGIDASAVRQALRDWDRPDRLARSALATGADPGDRVTSVRDLITRGIDEAFGTGPAEQQLREVLLSGVVHRTVAHEQVAADLHLSRSTYFRLLRLASERLEAYLAGP